MTEPTPGVVLELAAIDRQQARFGRLSLLAIVVSFVHMAAALALFSGPSWYEIGAALAMTALVDVATWALAGYFDYAARRQLTRSGWITATFVLALGISMFLNGVYLYAHRPPSLPLWMSVSIAVAFAVFVPLLIGVASLIRGELETDRLRIEQQAIAAPVELAPVREPPRRIAGARTRSLPLANTANTHAAQPLANGNSANTADALANTIDTAAAHPVTATPRPAPIQAEPIMFANGTSEHVVSTTDAAGIVAVLRAANVQHFPSARVLAQLCGWRSSSSGPKALRTLQLAGAVREVDGMFVLEPALVAQEAR